ncbi:MAG: aldose 1-epimerase family protein [Opitutaceae bacterium]|nr:aldose 1-epimerase family protein [Opitutaceae bacterium]
MNCIKATARRDRLHIVDLSAGPLSVRVCPTRGMGILSAHFRGIRLGWNSPVGEVVHPRDVNLKKDKGTGWLEGFSEFIVRCGLSSMGAPGPDRVTSPEGVIRTDHLTLHGRIANLPASRVTSAPEIGPNKRIYASGRVVESGPHGSCLELNARVELVQRPCGFRIVDRVVNRGKYPAELQLLYHCNFGPPILEADSRLLAPVEQVAGRDARSRRAIAALDRNFAPRSGFREQVYFMRLKGNRRGRTIAALCNAAGDLAVSLQFSLESLPCLTLWRQLGGKGEWYVVGIEPGTAFPNHRSLERSHGRVPVLAPGEERLFELDVRLHHGPAAISRLEQAITRIGARREIVPLSELHSGKEAIG